MSIEVFGDPSPLFHTLALSPSCPVVKLVHVMAHEVSGCSAALEGRMDCSQLTRLSFGVDGNIVQETRAVVLDITVCNPSATQGLVFTFYDQSITDIRGVLTSAFGTSPVYANAVRELTVLYIQNIVDAPLLGSLLRLTTLNHIFYHPHLPVPRTHHAEWTLKRNYLPVLAQASPDGLQLTCPGLTTLYLIRATHSPTRARSSSLANGTDGRSPGWASTAASRSNRRRARSGSSLGSSTSTSTTRPGTSALQSKPS